MLVAVKSDLFPSPSSLLLILVGEIITKWSGHDNSCQLDCECEFV